MICVQEVDQTSIFFIATADIIYVIERLKERFNMAKTDTIVSMKTLSTDELFSSSNHSLTILIFFGLILN
jgi:hypothetical protein